MPLSAGTSLGPYEIAGLLGAGGMGEVYRARDSRLGREVAVKILPAAFSGDPERARRFEQEARATSLLNHPNVLAVYDVGWHEGSFYIVSELLEGETLRQRLTGGALGARKAVEYALQIARGLSAAHQKQIVHRDLKPENIFVTRDGRAKILDFGLAKLEGRLEAAAADRTSAPTAAIDTDPGVVMGTAGYMAPEQVRGHRADHRSDIFAFGAILYEMLTGRRAFQGESSVETMNAILKEEPRDLFEFDPRLPPALDRVVRHCLEKNPQERFESAGDAAFALEALSDLSGRSGPVAAPRWGPRRRWLAAAALGLAAALAAGVFIGRGMLRHSAPRFQRLTFQRGSVGAARFGPDGQTIVYSAAWEASPAQVFTTRPRSAESRRLDIGESDLMAVSSSGELALGLRRPLASGLTPVLARAPLAGGVPRELLRDIAFTDWSPDGSTMAVVRRIRDHARIEYPPGKLLYESTGRIAPLRISPDDRWLAFFDAPGGFAGRGNLTIVNRGGQAKVLLSGLVSPTGLAWSPSGQELWFTAAMGGPPAVWAIGFSGKPRLINRMVGALALQDIARDGRVLLTHVTWRASIWFAGPGGTQERDLAWLDWSSAVSLSDDGKTILLDETREGALDPRGAVYLRRTDGSPAVRLGDGLAVGLSPDGQWALSLLRDSPPKLVLLPTGPGESRVLETGPVTCQNAIWFPDGKRILLVGNEPGRQARMYIQNLESGKRRPLGPEGVWAYAVSPDGKLVAGRSPQQTPVLYPVEGGEERPLAGMQPGEIPLAWSGDSRYLFTRQDARWTARIHRVDLATGQREPWKEITLSDPAGSVTLGRILLTPDGKSYLYNVGRNLSELYLAEGLQ